MGARVTCSYGTSRPQPPPRGGWRLSQGALGKWGAIPAVPPLSLCDTRAPRALPLLGPGVFPLRSRSCAPPLPQPSRERGGRRAPHGIQAALPPRAAANYSSRLSLPQPGPWALPRPLLLPAPAWFLRCRLAFPLPAAGRGWRGASSPERWPAAAPGSAAGIGAVRASSTARVLGFPWGRAPLYYCSSFEMSEA